MLYLKATALAALIYMGAWLIVQGVVLTIRMFSPRDATDPPKGERSGFQVYIDHETGLEYLVTSGGGVTPRLDQWGGHMNSKSLLRAQKGEDNA